MMPIREIVRRICRRLFPSKDRVSRAEQLRRISFRIETLASRPQYRERALSLLADFAAGRALRRVGQPLLILQEVFERDAGRIERITAHARTVRDMGFHATSRALAAPEFGFVRACLAYHAQDFVRAETGFMDYARRYPRSRAAIAARDVSIWLRQSGFLDAEVIASLRRDEHAAKTSSDPVLIIADCNSAQLETAVSRLPEGQAFVLLTCAASNIVGLPRRPLRVIAYSDAAQTSKQWQKIRHTFEEMRDAVAEQVFSQSPELRRVATTIRNLSSARLMPAWFLVSTLAQIARSERFSRITVVTAWPQLYSALAAAARTLSSAPLDATWTSRPRLAKDHLSYWPARTTVEVLYLAQTTGRLAFGGARWSIRQTSERTDNRNRPALAAIALSADTDVDQARDRICPLVHSAPAIVLVEADTGRLARLKDHLKSAAHPARLMPAELFARPLLADGADVSLAFASAADQIHRWRFRRPGMNGRMQTLAKNLVAQTMGAAPELIQLSATIHWLDGLRHNGTVLLPGRAGSVWISGLEEYLSAIGPSAPSQAASVQPDTAPAIPDDARPAARPAPPAPAALRQIAVAPVQSELPFRESRPVGVPDSWIAVPVRAFAHDGERRAFCETLIRQGRYTKRAEALLVAMGRRALDSGQAPAISSLPSLFADAAFDYPRMRNLAHGLMARGALPTQAQRHPQFGFVRGVVAFYRQDFPTALRELAAFADHAPEDPAAACARDIADWLQTIVHADPLLIRAMQSPELLPDMSSYKGKRLLVLTESTTAEVEPILAGLSSDTTATVIFRFLADETTFVPPNRKYVSPDPYVWYSESGKAIHRVLEQICERGTEQICAAVSRLRTIPWALRMQLIDGSLYDFMALQNFRTELASGGYDEALIVTRRYSLYRTAAELAASVLRRRNVNIAWIAKPTMPSAPGFAYWPVKQSIRTRLIQAEKSKRRRAVAGALPLPVTLKPADKLRPAVIVWSIGDTNYDRSLEHVVAAVLQRRPVALIVMGDTDENVEKLRSTLSPYVKAAKHDIQIVRYASFLEQGRANGAKILFAADQAVANTTKPDRFWRRNRDSLLSAVTRHDLASTFARSPHVAAIAAALDWLDALMATTKAAYVVTAPGRSAFPAAVAEHLGGYGVKAVDVHLYFLADQARQLKPPHHYVATVDSEMARFVESHWDVDPAHTLNIGYIWRDSHAVEPLPSADDTSEQALSVESKLILCATQPAPADVYKPFFKTVLSTIAGLDDVMLVIKPHPREREEVISWYHSTIAEAGLELSVSVAEGAGPIDPWLDRADVVITRTSNVGLEAARKLKPLVRGVMHDVFLPASFLRAPYAANARTPREMVQFTRQLLFDEDARAELRRRQAQYFNDNPSLLDGRGVARLVEFMEASLSHCSAAQSLRRPAV